MDTQPQPTTAPEADWTRRPERSNLPILRLMVWISLTLGRPIGRWVLHGVAAYFLAFAPAARRASRTYLARALGRAPTLADLFRHILTFATTIHDRIYLLNGRFDLFDIRIVGEHFIRSSVAEGTGVLLMGAHFGSFEVLRALGRKNLDIPVAMLMYEENARKINATLSAINPAATQDIIPLGRMESMLQARDRLEAGHLVGMLADRGLGSDPTRDCDFLGAAAPLPLGPFRMAAMLRRPVLLMVGLHLGGNRYEIHFEPLADFSAVERNGREAAIAAVQDRYVRRLEHFCRRAPYNWFNFFDFWNAPGREPAP
ncbi:MAG TPA: acyl-CoA synthetase [Rhodocyclaceae bacterium]|nr:acyl-CoA synthetase [Rhodocyclaceae bacterium]